MSKCTICKSDKIEQITEEETILYKGRSIKVPMAFSQCNSCGREFVSKQQIMANDVRVRDAKKSLDGLMTSYEVAQARRSLGLTQEQASKIFGGGKNAFSKYERGEVSQSFAMDKLIKVCLKHRGVLMELMSEIRV